MKPLEIPGHLKNMPCFQYLQVRRMGVGGRCTRGLGKESTKLSQIMEIQDNLTLSFIFNFLLENFTRVGRELKWLI